MVWAFFYRFWRRVFLPPQYVLSAQSWLEIKMRNLTIATIIVVLAFNVRDRYFTRSCWKEQQDLPVAVRVNLE